VNLPDNLLSEEWYWMAWVIWLLFFGRSIWRAPWQRLKDADQLNVWLGMIVLLIVIWSLKAGVKPGLSFHLLGAAVFNLCFGPHLAFIGLSIVLLGVTLNGAAGEFAFALNSLLLAGVGVALSQSVFLLVNRFLPVHLFVYIFVNGFFGAALMTLGVGTVATLFLAAAGAYPLDYLMSEYWPYFLLLGFSEAWISGMVITLFVIYRPNWIASFDDARYLANK
jgi:uncharacterized membrane protein